MRCAAIAPAMLSALLCSGCFPVGSMDSVIGVKAAPIGTFDLKSGSIGNVKIAPTTCSAGGRLLFLGGDFEDEKTGVTARLVIDPLEGPAARIFASASPSEKSIILRPSECRVFHASIATTGLRINEVDDYHLSLELDCTAKNGDSVIGRVSVSHCH